MYMVPQRLPGFNGLGWGQKATLDMDGGRVMHEIILESDTLDWDTDVAWVNLELNGDKIIRLKGSDLRMLERFRKRYQDARTLVVYLSDIVNAGLESRTVSRLVTFAMDQITLSVEVGSGTGPIDLKASVMVSAPEAARNFIPRKFRTNITAGQTTGNMWDKMTRGRAIQRVHFEGDLTRLEWRKDGATVWEREADLNELMLKRMDRAPQAGFYHFDAIESDFGIADLFYTNVQRELVAEYDIGTPGNLPMIIEMLEPVAASQGAPATV